MEDINERNNTHVNDNKIAAMAFAAQNNYEHVDNINEIPNGRKFYEINLNNNYLSIQHTRGQEFAVPESTKPMYLITNAELKKDVLQGLVEGGKRKSRRNQKNKKSRKGKLMKNRRKSNRRR